MRKKTLFAVICLIMAMACPGWAATYYVDYTDGLDTNDGSESNPFKSISKVNSIQAANDTFYFKRGEDWRTTANRLEAKYQNLTFDAYGSGDRPLLHRLYGANIGDWSGLTVQNINFDSSNEPGKPGCDLRQYNNLTMTDCDFSNKGNEGVKIVGYDSIYPQNVTLTRITASNNDNFNFIIKAASADLNSCESDTTTINSGMYLQPIGADSYITVNGGKSTNAASDGLYSLGGPGYGTLAINNFIAAANGGHGLNILAHEGLTLSGGNFYSNTLTGICLEQSGGIYCNDVDISGFTAHNNGEHGIWAPTQGESNIYNFLAYNNGNNNISAASKGNAGGILNIYDFEAYGGSDQILGSMCDSGDTVNIWKGWCHDGSDNGAAFFLHGEGTINIYNCKANNCFWGINGNSEQGTTVNAYNNTLSNCSYGAVHAVTPATITLKNNIIYGSGTIGIVVDTTLGTMVSDYNCIYGPTYISQVVGDASPNKTLAEWQALGYDAHSIVLDPLFFDASANDYRLRFDSPCRRAGTPIDGVTSDYAGNYIDPNHPDIGAYQYQPSVIRHIINHHPSKQRINREVIKCIQYF